MAESSRASALKEQEQRFLKQVQKAYSNIHIVWLQRPLFQIASPRDVFAHVGDDSSWTAAFLNAFAGRKTAVTKEEIRWALDYLQERHVFAEIRELGWLKDPSDPEAYSDAHATKELVPATFPPANFKGKEKGKGKASESAEGFEGFPLPSSKVKGKGKGKAVMNSPPKRPARPVAVYFRDSDGEMDSDQEARSDEAVGSDVDIISDEEMEGRDRLMSAFWDKKRASGGEEAETTRKEAIPRGAEIWDVSKLKELISGAPWSPDDESILASFEADADSTLRLGYVSPLSSTPAYGVSSDLTERLLTRSYSDDQRGAPSPEPWEQRYSPILEMDEAEDEEEDEEEAPFPFMGHQPPPSMGLPLRDAATTSVRARSFRQKPKDGKSKDRKSKDGKSKVTKPKK